MAGTSWPSLAAGQPARAADVENKFDWIEGSITPMTGGNQTDNTYDLGTSTARWSNIYGRNLITSSITATTVACGTAVVITSAPETPGTDTLYANNQVKGWADIDVSPADTTAASAISISSEVNVSSVTDMGAGDVRLNFARSLAFSLYGTSAIIDAASLASAVVAFVAAGSLRVRTFRFTATAAYFSFNWIGMGEDHA